MVKLNELTKGSEITFASRKWVILEPAIGFIYSKDELTKRAFDTDTTPPIYYGKNVFNPSDSRNIGYYLNNTFLNSLPQNEKNSIQSKTWFIGNSENESSTSVNAKIGLLTYSQWKEYSKRYNSKRGVLENPTTGDAWLITPEPTLNRVFYVKTDGYIQENWNNASYPMNSLGVYAAMFIDPNLDIVNGEVVYNATPIITLNTTDNRTLYENDIFSIDGTVTDVNSGDVVSVKYSIDGGAARAILANVSTGTAISYAKNLTYKAGALYDGATAVTGALSEGSQHSLKVWAEDDKGGKSAEITRTFYVVPNRAASLTLDAFVTRTGLINTDVVNIAGSVADLDNGNVIVKYKIGIGAFVQVFNGVVGPTPTPFNFNVLLADLADGDNQLTVQAVDAYNAITQQVLNIRKSKNEVPLLEAVTYYEITPPNGTADGLQLYIEREVGDLVVAADVYMGAPGQSEVFVPMTLASTANLTNGNAEDTFAYEHTNDASKIVVRIKMTRTSDATNKAIKKISGVLT